MANVEQLELLQERIGSEPVMPDALDRYRALKMLQKRPIKREGGGQLDTIEDIASKGRYGDTMLMHVNPREVSGLDSLGKMTYNPETGLPEAWLWALPLAGAAIGGIGAKLMDKDPLTGALIGGGIGLGGMGLAGAGASGLGGLFGAGSAGALPGLWKGLGPIGQGMLTGGAMGGISGLFGQSENPMRDMLLGAAMGGVGGALFGGGTGTGADLIEGGALGGADMATVTGPTVPVAETALNVVKPAYTPLPSGGYDFGSFMPKPTISPPTPGIVAASQARGLPAGQYDFGSSFAPKPTGASVPTYKPRAVTDTRIKAGTADTAAVDPSKADGKTFFGGLKDWWKDREWYEKAGLAGGAGLLGYGLLSGGEQAELEEPEPIQPFEKGERKTPLQPIQPLTEEQILAAYSGPSGTGIDTWFQPQVAKEGGLLSVAKLAQGSGGHLIPQDPYVQYTGPMAQPIYLPRPSPTSSAPPPPPPPEITDPFVSNIPSFNVQDALSRITGQSVVPEQITLPTPSQLPALATASQLPAGNIQQGASALSDLFSRFQQAQGDPIVDIVTATGAVPETASAKEGGIVALNAGGMFGGYTYGPSAALGKSASPGSAAATKAAKSLGLTGEVGQRLGGGEGWTNISSPTVVSGPGPAVQSAPLGKRGKALVNALNSIVSGYEGWRGETGLLGQLGTPLAVHALLGKGSPMGLHGYAMALGNMGGYTSAGSPGGQLVDTRYRDHPSGNFPEDEDPYYVNNPILETANQGGIVGLARGGVFEGRVQGQGDGMADKVAFNVVPQTPADIPNTPDMALLSSDEYVVPADVVSMLGNGSSTAGAQSLDKFNQLMRKKAHGTNKQQRELNAGKELSSLV